MYLSGVKDRDNLNIGKQIYLPTNYTYPNIRELDVSLTVHRS